MKMRKVMNKAAVIMLTGLLAIPLTAGLSAAENKLIVQDPSANDVFVVDDSGNTGFNLSTPNYAADVANNGGAAKAELHFSKDGADNGGWLTSVAENNFFISSGGVYDAPAGGWIQKAVSGQSVFFGSGGAGFRAYLQEGNTPGAVMTNVNQVMLIDYSGNLTMNGGVQMNNGTAAQPACASSTQGMFWMTKGVTDTVEICASKGGSLAWYPVSF